MKRQPSPSRLPDARRGETFDLLRELVDHAREDPNVVRIRGVVAVRQALGGLTLRISVSAAFGSFRSACISSTSLADRSARRVTAFAYVVEMGALIGVPPAVIAADVFAVGDVAQATGVPAPHSQTDDELLFVRDGVARTMVGLPEA